MEERQTKEQCRMVTNRISTPLSDRASFRPAPVGALANAQAKRSERGRIPTKNARKSTKPIDIPSLMTVWLRIRVPPVRHRRLVAFTAGQRLHIYGVMPLRSS